jgi:hypothetical protein
VPVDEGVLVPVPVPVPVDEGVLVPVPVPVPVDETVPVLLAETEPVPVLLAEAVLLADCEPVPEPVPDELTVVVLDEVLLAVELVDDVEVLPASERVPASAGVDPSEPQPASARALTNPTKPRRCCRFMGADINRNARRTMNPAPTRGSPPGKRWSGARKPVPRISSCWAWL